METNPFTQFENEDERLKMEEEKIRRENNLAKIELLKKTITEQKKLLAEKKQKNESKREMSIKLKEELEIGTQKQQQQKGALEKKINDIITANDVARQQKYNQVSEKVKKVAELDKNQALKIKQEKESIAKRKNELNIQYQERIEELKQKLNGLKEDLCSAENKYGLIETECAEIEERGIEIRDHINETVKEIKNISEKLSNITQEKNKLLKEKAQYEEEILFNRMIKHCEKGNSMIGELEDGTNIMKKNLKIVNQKCVEVQKKIALKNFQVVRLREAYANLLYDLKKKNNWNNSNNLVEEQIIEFKHQIEELCAKLMDILHKSEVTPLMVGDENVKYVNNLWQSKKKAIREVVQECHKICEKNFLVRENVFKLECEFRNLKTELKDLNNKLIQKQEELINSNGESIDKFYEEKSSESLRGNTKSLGQKSEQRNDLETMNIKTENVTVVAENSLLNDSIQNNVGCSDSEAVMISSSRDLENIELFPMNESVLSMAKEIKISNKEIFRVANDIDACANTENVESLARTDAINSSTVSKDAGSEENVVFE